MNWNSIIVAISLVMLTIPVTLGFLMTRANAGGPGVINIATQKVQTIVVKNEKGEVIDKQSVETLICDDGRNDSLSQWYSKRMQRVLVRDVCCRKMAKEERICPPKNLMAVGKWLIH